MSGYRRSDIDASSLPSLNEDIGFAPNITQASEHIDNAVSPDAI
jgi:hypothetical protein